LAGLEPVVPGYHQEDAVARARFGAEAQWSVIARVEDLSDQRPELSVLTPGRGRTFTALLARGW
jgi:hypothetical protein